jgi:acetyl-CoA carboxylase beta subunit
MPESVELRGKRIIAQEIRGTLNHDFPKVVNFLSKGDTDAHPEYIVTRLANAIYEALEKKGLINKEG